MMAVVMTEMWEVRAAEGVVGALVEWVVARVDPGAQVYRSDVGEPRVVVIDPSCTASRELADPPADLIARPPHAWQFERVGNE